jgi:ADP-heptose:LPS heptosyltransferase
VSNGEDIMATGEVKLICKDNPNAKVTFGSPETFSKNSGEKSKFYWSDIFENNPNILQPGDTPEELIISENFPTSRPFINYARTRYNETNQHKTSPYKIAYNSEYEATRGELFFNDDEIAAAQELIRGLDTPTIFLNPYANFVNKHWLEDRWYDLIKKSSYHFAQLTYDSQQRSLDDVAHVKAKSFRQACAVLSVGTEHSVLLGVDSHLHHAAAAVNLPSIVLWSHYSHPDNLGYSDHINIRWDAAGNPCGLRDACIQCKKSMEMIKVDDVILAIKMALKNTP